MPAAAELPSQPPGASSRAVRAWRRWVVSALVVVPCVWQPRLEAGDLASHTYNAWLALLIEAGQAKGLYLGRQWTNVVVDILLSNLGALLGFAAAERIVAAGCVLIFFWGALSLVRATTDREPWTLAPAAAMAAYGWTFWMGLLNFYLSIGLAFWALARIWRGGRGNWLRAAALGALCGLAHPLGLLSLAGFGLYVTFARKTRGGARAGLAGAGLAALLAAHFYVIRFRTAYWDSEFFYRMNGTDQLILFGRRYEALAFSVLAFCLAAFLAGALQERRRGEHFASRLRTPLELWLLLLAVPAAIPEAIFLPQYPVPVSLIVARLTTVTAVLGLCVLGQVEPRWWHLAGLAALAGLYFTWVYEDTLVLNGMEAQAESLVSRLPYGRRVVGTIGAPFDSRITNIGHVVDRACVGRCFSYANYEPSSGQFRVHAAPGSPIAAASPYVAQMLDSGEHRVRPEDLPMTQIYQCGPEDLTKLCMRDLVAGERNGAVGYRPPKTY